MLDYLIHVKSKAENHEQCWNGLFIFNISAEMVKPTLAVLTIVVAFDMRGFFGAGASSS